jgi:hypothetical protein
MHVAFETVPFAHPGTAGKNAPPQPSPVIVEQGGEENVAQATELALIRVKEAGSLDPAG